MEILNVHLYKRKYMYSHVITQNIVGKNDEKILERKEYGVYVSLNIIQGNYVCLLTIKKIGKMIKAKYFN